ncbi:MAG: metallophosphoesterase [Thermodesulfovibrionales bacterium]
MLIGVISDTHDDMASIKKAVQILNERGAARIIHAGDIVSPFTFEVFKDLKGDFTGIFGNNDGDRLLLREKSGNNIHNQPLILNIDKKKIIVVHEPYVVDELAESGHFDIVIYGHTHKPDVRRVRDTLIINPGKVAVLHKGRSTLAILNTRSMDVDLVEL